MTDNPAGWGGPQEYTDVFLRSARRAVQDLCERRGGELESRTCEAVPRATGDSAVEVNLQQLLTEYGPPNRTAPAYPFHHLVSDGVWEVRTDRGSGSPGSRVRELRAAGAAGRLAPELRAALRRESELLGRGPADGSQKRNAHLTAR